MAKITVHTQYHENYSDTLVPHWKAKGGQKFVIDNADGDIYMYCELSEILTTLVEQQSNDHYKYTYLDHEIDFVEEDDSITPGMLMTEIRKFYT